MGAETGGADYWCQSLMPPCGTRMNRKEHQIPRIVQDPWTSLLTQLSQERIRREIRHFAQSMQCNMFALKLGPLDKNDNRIRAVGDEISKIVTNSDDVHLEFHWMFRHL